MLKTGVASLDRVKVYFCGQPEAGKTTLSRALAGVLTTLPDESNSLKMRTRGIDIMQVRLPNGTEYSFWDFAGQADYHVHHDLFLFPEAAVFVLIIDARKSDAERKSHATYWLQYIVTQCPPGTKPNVLLIASHPDEVPHILPGDVYTLEAYLLAMYESISEVFGETVNFLRKDFILADCRNSQSESFTTIRNELNAARERFAVEENAMAPLICKQMIDLLVPIREARVHFMTLSHFHKAMKSVSGDTGLLTAAIRHLHKIGDVFYNEVGPLADIVVIDLAWLCHEVLGWLFCPVDMLEAHQMMRLLKFRQLAEAGPVKISDVPIINAFDGTSIKTLDILEAFELCSGFYQGSDKMYVFPSLLRTQIRPGLWTSSGVFDSHIGIRFVCKSPTVMIPPGFFQRLQVQVREKIGPLFTPSNADFVWQNGTVCIDGEVQCRIILANDGRSVYVHVRGPSDERKQCREMILRVLLIVQQMHAFSRGLDLSLEHCRFDDLAKYESEPHCFSQQIVLDARRKGKKRVMDDHGQVDLLPNLLGLEGQGQFLRLILFDNC